MTTLTKSFRTTNRLVVEASGLEGYDNYPQQQGQLLLVVEASRLEGYDNSVCL